MDMSTSVNDKRQKEVLVTEPERNSVLYKEDEALRASEETVDRSLRGEKLKEDGAPAKLNDPLSDFYECMFVDYITILTIATVALFSSNPWAALFWPPYYYYYNNKRDPSSK